jgi:hypothetical protein
VRQKRGCSHKAHEGHEGDALSPHNAPSASHQIASTHVAGSAAGEAVRVPLKCGEAEFAPGNLPSLLSDQKVEF